MDTASAPDPPSPTVASAAADGGRAVPGDAAPPDAAEPDTGLVARWTRRYEATRKVVTGRLDVARGESKVVDVTATVVMRPRYASDALVAGYLAMRMFVLLFPLAYVAVSAIGLVANNSGESSTEATAHTGLAGAVANSVAHAASGSQRNQVIALIVGLMATAWAGRGALHAGALRPHDPLADAQPEDLDGVGRRPRRRARRPVRVVVRQPRGADASQRLAGGPRCRA